MKKIYYVLTFFALTLLVNTAKSQLSGTYSVPASYATIDAAITALNTQGVSGPVTILVNAGHTETAPVGGFSMTATGTGANPIIFQKNGAGANPLITAYTGTALPNTTTTQDGVWRLIGSDYITIDGIDIVDPNTSGNAMMEFGYGLFKASTSNGCQNNTIANCVITLNKNNNTAGAGVAVEGSRGIEIMNTLSNAHTAGLTIVAASGANSNNKIYSNTIQNCNYGIALIGFAATTPFTFADTGNDIGGSSVSTGNTIINFGGGPTTGIASAGVRTLAQYNINVAYNYVNNNNGSGAPNVSTLRGIYLNTAVSANSSITNNTVTMNSGANTSAVSAIENVAGSTAASNSVVISNNLIANGTSSTTSGAFNGIYNTASSATLIMSNNTFTNNSSNATTGISYLLRTSGAVASLIDISNNNFSHSLTGPLLTSADIQCIYTSGTGTTTNVFITNNNFISFNHGITGTGDVYCVRCEKDAVNMSITGNMMNNLILNHTGGEYFIYNSLAGVSGSLTIANNSINNITRTGASTGSFYGYYNSAGSIGTSMQFIYNNLLSNISSTVSGAGSFHGVYNSSGGNWPYPLKAIYNNTVTNVNYNGTGTGYGLYATSLGDAGGASGSSVYNNTVNNLTYGDLMYGMYIAAPTSTNNSTNIYSNSINNITTTGSSTVFGTYLGSGGSGINYYKNKISDITSNGTTGMVHGIYGPATTTTNIYNNLVGNLYAPNATGYTRVNGIYINTGTVVNVYYNTVYLNATSTGADFHTNAVYSSTLTNLTLRNNIFVNLSTPTGTGLAVAYRRQNIQIGNYNLASNDNLFYAGTPGASNLIFTDGTNNYQSLSTYISAFAPADASSITENPTFVSTVGSNANFLNINAVTPTQIESSGTAIAGINDDYIGTVRSATPDIGAWEGNYTLAQDNNAPTFLQDGFTTSACNLTSRTYTINMTDVSGVASGSLSPQLYYSVNGGPYTSVSGTLTSGASINGVWTFNLTYAGNALDVISYYVVAQDIAPTPNIGALPGGGFTAVDVNNVTTPPTTPFTYTLNATLNGTYTVGVAGNFTTLTQAANVYNPACLTGPVTYVLTDPSYSTNENFPIVFLNNTDASATNSLLIVPATGNSATVTTGSTFTNTTMKFLNARFITVDGLNTGGSALTIANTWTTTNSAAIWLASTPTTGPGNNTLEFKRLSIVGPSTTSTARYGILASAESGNPVTTTGPDNDNITIQSNTITSTYYGIYATGTATINVGGSNNWIIDNNNIGTATSNIGFRGIFATNAPSITITNNTIQNLTPGASGMSGIFLSSGLNNAAVSQNTISNITCTAIASGATGAATGINIGTNVMNSVIEKNVILNVTNTHTAGYSGRGITINTSANSNTSVRNNMISGISGTGDNTVGTVWPLGITLEGSSGGVNIENNSVNLSASIAGLPTASASAAMYIATTGTNNVIRNNIFCNTYDNTNSATDVAFGVYSSAATGTNISIMNYNDYYVGGTGNIPVMGYVASTQQLSLPAMQASFGGNLNSQNVLPVFVSPTDLHLQSVFANGLIDNTGTPVAGITVDIDNQIRNVTTPDIGADEFSTPSCTAAVGGTITSASVNLCNGQSTSITSNSTSVGSTSTYQWMSSTTPGGPYTNVSGGTGANSTSYNSAALSTGTLYFVLEVGCGAASQTMTSNEATVVINPIPTASIVSGTSACLGQTLALDGGSDIGSNYNWSGPNSFTSASQNNTVTNVTAAAAGLYTLIVSTANCTSTPVTASVTVNSTSVNITASPFAICTGGTTTLTAVGTATSYVWSTSAITNSIVVSPASATVYSVTGTGTTGCTAGASYSLSITSPTINAVGASVCSPGTTTISVNAFANNVNWYATPTSTTTIATGTAYVPPTAVNTVTYYAEAYSTPSNSLFVSSAAGNSSAGNMFDIVALDNIEINGFDVHVGTATYTLQVWYRPGSYATFTNSTAGWTMAGTTTITGMGSGNITPVPMTISVPMSAGQTYGFCVTLTGSTMYYTNGTTVGSVWAANSDLQLLQGNGGAYFNYNFSPRCFNGVVKYSKAGCISPLVPVVLTVNQNPTVTISASNGTICAGNTSTLTASGATTYSWNTSATTTVITVSPSSTTIYTVTGDNSGCTGTETVAVNVNALPSLTLTAAQTTVCTNGPTVTLTGSPAGGAYSGTNVSGNVFTPGASAGTFNPVYSYTSPVTGCSNTTSASIVVSTCTGLDKISGFKGLSVYPNPTAGEITIELNNGMDKTVQVTDLTGRIIFTAKTTKDKLNVSLNEFANGVYFVKIQSNEVVEIVKVVKQ
jgi:hypothetical protein